MVGIDAFRVFFENNTQYWALFSTKPTKVGFIFIRPNSP